MVSGVMPMVGNMLAMQKTKTGIPVVSPYGFIINPPQTCRMWMYWFSTSRMWAAVLYLYQFHGVFFGSCTGKPQTFIAARPAQPQWFLCWRPVLDPSLKAGSAGSPFHCIWYDDGRICHDAAGRKMGVKEASGCEFTISPPKPNADTPFHFLVIKNQHYTQ